ncbi:hypothetical protein U9K52_10015 [Chryseobacterium sp. MHB01]|uniref:hypothetical protein n=1 Tax=Chryseobacterium sp. MHB01 TaxID=3109433 RepID=UPI002AFF95C2|nr:hypothetical protein [Chryseobacterium sp. MHB01]MEA1849248.1 hypothetical protein [Chryseobacterium sp. MHB01]
MNISEQFLTENGFQKKQSDETYFESVLNSSEPQTTIYVYPDQVSMQVGGSGPERPLKVFNENQLLQFIQTLQSVL